MAISAGEIEATLRLKDELSGKLSAVNTELTKVAHNIQSFGMRVTEAGRAMLPFSAAVGGLGTFVVKAAADFEWSFAGVQRTVEGVVDSTGEMTPVGKQIREEFRLLALEIPATTTELNNIGTAAGQLGIGTDYIIEFTRVMAALGITTNLTSEEAAMAIGRIQTIFKTSGKDVDRFGAALVELGRSGASTETEIVRMAVRVAGAAKQIGMSQADVLSLSTILSNVGVRAEAGGTALSKLMIAIADDITKGSDRLKVFAAISGTTVDEFVKLFRDDAAVAIGDFIVGLGSAEEGSYQAITAIDELSMSEVRLRMALLNAAGSAEKVTQTLNDGRRAWQENTALAVAARQKYQTFMGTLKLFRNQIEYIATDLGNELLPILEKMLVDAQPWIDWLKQAVEGFKALPPETKKFIAQVVMLASVAAPALIMLGAGIRLLAFAFELPMKMVILFGKALLWMVPESVLQSLRILAAQIHVFGIRAAVAEALTNAWAASMKALRSAQMWLWANAAIYSNIEIFGLRTGIAVTLTAQWAKAMDALRVAQLWLWANTALYSNIEIFGLRTGIALTLTAQWAKAMAALKAAQLWLWANVALYSNIEIFGLRAVIATAATNLWAKAMALLGPTFTIVRSALSVLAGPVGWFLGALGLLVAWLKYTEIGNRVLADSWKWLTDVGRSVVSIMGSIWSITRDVAAIVGMVVVDVFKGFISVLSDFALMVGGFVVGALKEFIAWITPAPETIKLVKDAISSAITYVQEFGLAMIRIIPGGDLFIKFMGWARDILGDISGYAKRAADKVHEFAQATGAIKDELPKVKAPMVDLGAATAHQADLTRLLSDEFTASITPIRKVGFHLGDLTGKNEELEESIKKLVAQYDGSDIKNGFATWIGALPQIGDLTKRTIEEQNEMRETLGKLIDRAVAMGKEVPPAISEAYKVLADNTLVKDAFSELAEKSRELTDHIIADNLKQSEEVKKIKGEAFTDSLGAAADAYDMLFELTATDTQRQIRQAEIFRDGTLTRLEPLKTLWPAVYEHARAATLAVYEKMAADAGQVTDSISEFWDSVGDVETQIMELKSAGFSTAEILERLGSTTDSLADTVRILGIDLATLPPELRKIIEAAIEAQNALNFSKAVNSFANLLEALGAAGVKGLGEVAEWLKVVNGAADLAEKSTLELKGSLALLGSGDIIGGLTGIFNGVAGIISAMDAATKSTDRAQAMLGGAFAGAKALKMFGPWGQAIGAVGGALLGLVRSAGQGRDAVKEFASSMGGFDALREKLNALGAEGERLWVNLTQGVGKNNPAQAKAAIDAINAALQKQTDDIEAAAAALEKYGVTWSQLKGEAQAKALSKIIKELAEDTRLLMLAGLDHDGALRAQAEAYNKLILESARAGVQMPLDLLKVAMEMAKLGLLTEETMAALLGGVQSTLPGWEEMQAAAEKYGISLEALGPHFQQSKLTELLAGYAKDFDLLIRGGADLSAVAAGMADEVNAAIQDAMKYGLEIPASMKPLIQALIDSGQLLDENGNIIKDMAGLKFGETMAESTDRLIKKLDELIKALTEGVGGAIGGIVRDIEAMTQREYMLRFRAQVTTNVDGPRGPGGQPPIDMAIGGAFHVTKPTLFRVGENGPEDAYFSGANRGFEDVGVSGGGGGGEQTIVVQLGDDVILRKVVRGMPRYLKLIGAQ